MRTEKQQYNNYVKLMKMISKSVKNGSYAKKVIGKTYPDTDTVYISDSCSVFGIPMHVYEQNYEACKCPSIEECANCNVDLRKIIMDNFCNTDATECTLTTMKFVSGNRIINVYNTGKTYGTENKTEFGCINEMYSEMISLLPMAIDGYKPKTINRKTPLAFYSDIIDSGYAICPINFDVVQALSNLGFEQV